MRGNTRNFPDLQVSEELDSDRDHAFSFAFAAAKAQADHFSGCHFTLEMLAVEPLCQKRGYAKRLMEFGIGLAQADDTAIGVHAADEAVPFYLAMGFEHIVEFNCEPDELAPEGVKAHIMVYSPV